MKSGIKELIAKKCEYGDLTNDLTREIDTYLKYKDTRQRTYIYGDPFISADFISWGIRFPGATRGYIQVNKENIITDVVLYNDDYHTDKIYEDNVRECFEKYIGIKFVIVE